MSTDVSGLLEGKKLVGTLLSPVYLSKGQLNTRKSYTEIEILGKLVCFLHEGNPVLSQVTEVSTYNPYMDPRSYLGKGNMGYVSDHGKIPHTASSDIRFVDINFLHMLMKAGDKVKLEIVRNSPATGLDVFEADSGIFKEFYPFNFPDNISLGKYRGTDCDLPISVREIKETHCGIFGKTGWGKTVLQSYLAGLLTRTGSKILIIDHTGDYSHEEKLAGKIFKELAGDFKIFKATDIRADHDLLEIKLADDIPWNRVLATTQYYIDQFVQYLASEIREVYTEESQLSQLTDDRFVELVRNVVPLVFSENTANNKLRILNARETTLRTWFNTKIKPLVRRPISYKDICEKLNSKNVVIDLSGQELKVDEKCLYLYKTTHTIYQKAKSDYEREHKGFDLVIIVDEAHNYVPQTKVTGAKWQIKSKEILITLAKEGRKYGTAVCLADQRMTSVDKDAIDFQTYFLGRLQMKGDKEHVDTMFGKDVLNIVNALNKFEFVVVGSANPLSDNGSPIKVYHPIEEMEYVKKIHSE